MTEPKVVRQKNVNPRVFALSWARKLNCDLPLIWHTHLREQRAACFLVPLSAWFSSVHAYDVLLEVHETTTAVVAMRALYMLLFSMHQHVAIQDLLQRSCEIAYCTRKLSGIVYPTMHVPLGNCPEPHTAHLAREILLFRMFQGVASKI